MTGKKQRLWDSIPNTIGPAVNDDPVGRDSEIVVAADGTDEVDGTGLVLCGLADNQIFGKSFK